jgi:anaerobic magnesium-protoporphyrin IX monomethyl ester cyclase
MKFLLVTYAGPRHFFDMYIPDPGIAQIAAVLKSNNIEVVIEDLNLLGNSFEGIIKKIKLEKPDCVAFKFFDTGFSGIMHLSKVVRLECSSCIIIGVGPHVTLFGEHVLHYTDGFDFIVIGEGEVTALHIIEYIEGRRKIADISNIIYRDSLGNIVKTPREFIEDLDVIPIPSWDSLSLDRYFPLLLLNGRRGCPFSCAFCAHNYIWNGNDPRHRMIREKSLNRLIQETDIAIDKLGVRLFGFTDSLPNTNLMLSWAKHLIDSDRNAIWSSFATIGQFNSADLKLLSESGCKSLWIGVESGDQVQLNRIGKNYSNADVIKTFDDLHDYGIVGVAGFVMGFPGETQESISNTLSLINNLKNTISVISPYILDPGSPVALNPEVFGVELSDNWEGKIVNRNEINEFNIPYYRVSNQWNDEFWSDIVESTKYKGWESDRTIAESEHAAVLACALGVSIDEFVREVTLALNQKDKSKIQKIVNKVWSSI